MGEAAELERVKYNTMVKRVLRKQESFVTKTEKSENGGKDVVLVAVSSLSKQASVTIDTENLNILVDEKLDINITYVPMGHVREMNLTFAVENPYAAS